MKSQNINKSYEDVDLDAKTYRILQDSPWNFITVNMLFYIFKDVYFYTLQIEHQECVCQGKRQNFFDIDH